MKEFVWSVNSNLKSLGVEGCFCPSLAVAGRRDGVFLCRLALFHFRKLSMLANCIFADRILSEYGVCELLRGGCCGTVSFTQVFASVS